MVVNSFNNIVVFKAQPQNIAIESYFLIFVFILLSEFVQNSY